MKNSSKYNLVLNPKMKSITISFICLFFVLNTQAANYNDLKLELEIVVKLTSIKEIINENPNFGNISINPVEENIKKNTFIEIANNFSGPSFSEGTSSFTSTHSISKANKSFTRKTLSITSTTNSNQVDTPDFRSELILDFLTKKRKAAFNPTTVYTHSEKIGKLKLKAKVKSIKLTVYF